MKRAKDQPHVSKSQPVMFSPLMERIAKTLAAAHGMDWSQKGAFLSLAMPGRAERWLLINLDGERFSLTCCLVEQDDTLTPEVDMVFTIHPEGWEPIELLYSNEIFAPFVQAAHAAALPIYDTEGNLRFDTFTEYWAKQLEEQGWVEHGHPLLDQESYGRMTGCQSTNHDYCYGELWQCAACGKTVCYAEGTDNHPELCDDCWTAQFATGDEADTQGVTFLVDGSLLLACDCPEQCGALLKLTHDGFLVLEDKDGLLVSFMLPDWLDFAIRRAMLAHTAPADDELGTQATDVEPGRLDDEVPF